MGPADYIPMTPELIATAGIAMLACAALLYLLHRQRKLTNKALDVIDAYKHALDVERKAHRSTQEAHRNEILCSNHWFQQLFNEQEAHESTKRDLLAERSEHGTEARNVDARTI